MEAKNLYFYLLQGTGSRLIDNSAIFFPNSTYMTTKPIVSILIGSGFSIPDGLPDVTQLNKRLAYINEGEIMIHSDLTAFFLNGYDDPNRWQNRDERLFLQEFLEFYNEEILKADDSFHYETFYDFYSGYLTKREFKTEIEWFHKRFEKKYFEGAEDRRDCWNRVSNFNRSFNQLVASQLERGAYYQDVATMNYPPYDAFLNFLRDLLKVSEIKFHTLNHDLLFDYLGRHHDALWQNFSDGFKLEGSPFYGQIHRTFNAGTENEVRKQYYVKLEQFVGKYDKSLCYYKLHGSVNNLVAFTHDSRKVHLKSDYAVSSCFMETTNPSTGDVRFERLWDEAAPDFLSGTTNKTRYYTGDDFYRNLFNHFEHNLANSELLVVIGYGFKDVGINEYLEKHFLSRHKPMVVIDPNKPATDLIEKYNAKYIPKGVTDILYPEYIAIIPPELRQLPA